MLASYSSAASVLMEGSYWMSFMLDERSMKIQRGEFLELRICRMKEIVGWFLRCE